MRSTCGQAVGMVRISLGKAGAKLSTFTMERSDTHTTTRVKLFISPKLSDIFTRLISPSKAASLPLVEHYFYPVSTVPINNYNQMKIKER